MFGDHVNSFLEFMLGLDEGVGIDDWFFVLMYIYPSIPYPADMCNFARFNWERLLADASTSGTVFLAR